MSEEEWEEQNGIVGEKPETVTESFEENVTEDVVVGHEKVSITVSESDNDTVKAIR